MSQTWNLLSTLRQETSTNVENSDAQSRMLGIINELESSIVMTNNSKSKTAEQCFLDDLEHSLQVCVCGGGHGAHAFVATITGSLYPQFVVNWLSFHGGGMRTLCMCFIFLTALQLLHCTL